MILFDNNISPSLTSRLGALFPECAHVRHLALHEADDATVWSAARTRRLAIASKDDDFRQLSLLRGHPPKVLWLCIGNCTTSRIHSLLTLRANDIKEFLADTIESFMVLR